MCWCARGEGLGPYPSNTMLFGVTNNQLGVEVASTSPPPEPRGPDQSLQPTGSIATDLYSLWSVTTLGTQSWELFDVWRWTSLSQSLTFHALSTCPQWAITESCKKSMVNMFRETQSIRKRVGDSSQTDPLSLHQQFALQHPLNEGFKWSPTGHLLLFPFYGTDV